MPQKDFSLTDAERCVIITKWDIRFFFLKEIDYLIQLLNSLSRCNK